MAYTLRLGRHPGVYKFDREIKGKSCICAIIKDACPYVREWALYYKKWEFDKIVFFDKDSTRPYEEELGEGIREGYIEIRCLPSEQWS